MAEYTPRQRAVFEQFVRDEVVAQTLGELPALSLRQKLAASHFELSSSVSPLAIVRHQRAGRDLRRALSGVVSDAHVERVTA
ncbi:MAG: hypothetical protein E5V91_22795 [Mesorhizobium sp.]|nr:MAG: hypothetical protein E5V91_22795 [Mesorhizobium sp.]